MELFWLAVLILIGITITSYLIVGLISVWLFTAVYKDQYERQTGQRR